MLYLPWRHIFFDLLYVPNPSLTVNITQSDSALQHILQHLLPVSNEHCHWSFSLPTTKLRGFVSDMQFTDIHRCSSNQRADSKGSLWEPDDLEILTSGITKVVHYYSSDGLEVESEDGWKDKMMKKGWEDEWIATVKEGRVYNLSLNLSLMDGWKEEVRGLMMKTGELWVSHCPHVFCRSAEKGADWMTQKSLWFATLICAASTWRSGK